MAVSDPGCVCGASKGGPCLSGKKWEYFVVDPIYRSGYFFWHPAVLELGEVRGI